MAPACPQFVLVLWMGEPKRAIPFYIHTPPPPAMEEVSQNLPLRNQRSKVPTRAPLQKLPKFSFPLRKKPIFFQTPSEIFKRSKAPTQRPLRNDDQGPLRESLPSGGCGY